MTLSRTTARLTALTVGVASTLAASALAAATADAASGTFSQPGAIQINDQYISSDNPTPITVDAVASGVDAADVYPSSIALSGHPGSITGITVALNNLTHAYPDDLDVMLVGPNGQQVMLMSDVTTSGSAAANDATVYFSDASTTQVGATLDSGTTYAPTNIDQGDADVFPAPAPDSAAAGTDLRVFDGVSPNGTWSLYVADDYQEDGGTFAGGWSLYLETDASPAIASPYPSALDVNGLPVGVTDVDVTLKGFRHTYPDDVDVMLVGPGGQSTMLMSDVGGSTDVSGVNLTFDDEAADTLTSSSLSSGTYRPSQDDSTDEFPAPAPSPDGASPNLSVFDGTNPNGTWKLFVVDQYGGDEGEIAGGWSLNISTVDGPTAPTLTSPTSGTDSDGIVTFAGAAPSGTTVTILDGTAAVATTTSDGAGHFTVSLAGVADGSHTYTAKATDGFGNVSAGSNAATVVVDKVAPTGTVTINSGAARTRSTSVTLSLASSDPAPGTGVTQMRFSNDGKSFSPFEPVASTKAWKLTSVNGTKTVWVQFADQAGQVSGTVADSIVLDTVSPSVLWTKPATKATGVKIGKTVKAKASEALSRATVSKRNVKLVPLGRKKAVRAVIGYNARRHVITINPKHDLARGTTYKVVISTAVRDLAGNALDQKKKRGLQPAVWRFTTS